MTDLIYISTNTASQAIDTFDPPTEQSLIYEIVTYTNTDISTIHLTLNHDGVSTAEYQSGFSLSNTRPLIFSTDIDTSNSSQYTGRILVTPSTAQTTFKISRTPVLCNLYSENTTSGRMIHSNTGMGIHFASNTMTVRQENNNFFGNVYNFMSSNTLGPSSQNPELLTTWISTSGSGISINNTVLTITSSAVTNNYQYQEIDVEVGKVYKLSGNAYYADSDTPNAYIETEIARQIPSIRIGSTPSAIDYYNFQPTTSDTSFSTTFAPTTDKVYISIGNGKLNSILVANNISFKEASPFNSYDYTQGTIYTKWNAVAAGNTLHTFNTTDGYTRRAYIDSSNNLIITCNDVTVNCGAQSTTNKVVYTYSNGSIIASLNGGAIVSNVIITPISKVANLAFTSLPLEFSYMAEVLSNTTIVGIST